MSILSLEGGAASCNIHRQQKGWDHGAAAPSDFKGAL